MDKRLQNVGSWTSEESAVGQKNDQLIITKRYQLYQSIKTATRKSQFLSSTWSHLQIKLSKLKGLKMCSLYRVPFQN